jgi:hypothetical protein
MKSIYSLKTKNGLFTFPHNNTRYIVGFHSRHHLNRVKEVLQPRTDITLYRNEPEDVSKEVEYGLNQMGISSPSKNIVIDANATLLIPKSVEKDKDDMLVIACPYQSFMLFPFTHNMGIVMAHYLEEEDDKVFHFLVDVIEPS